MASGIRLELLRLCPINHWQEDAEGEHWTMGDKRPRYIIDLTTGDKYLNQSNKRIKCGLLVIGTLTAQSLGIIMLVVFNIIRMLSFYHFWKDNYKTEYNLKGRLADLGKDGLRILISPLVLIFFEMAAIEGIFKPFDGAKVYANLELAYYGFPLISVCFQKDAKKHLFSGNIDDPDAW